MTADTLHASINLALKVKGQRLRSKVKYSQFYSTYRHHYNTDI